jgi:hypothetical protein
MAVRRSPPTLRLVCPCPVRSSNRTASPAPNRRVVPSPITTSIWPPARKMAYWRRGALCQSLKRPLGDRVKVILLAACSIDLSTSGGSRSRSSKRPRYPVRLDRYRETAEAPEDSYFGRITPRRIMGDTTWSEIWKSQSVGSLLALNSSSNPTI